MEYRDESPPFPWLLAIVGTVLVSIAMVAMLSQADPWLVQLGVFAVVAWALVVVLIAIPVGSALIIWLIVRSVNRRDDPRFAKIPRELP